MAEIVTFQMGNLSNFVGSHWWNIQESSFVYEGQTAGSARPEINHDVTFREGQTLKGEVTYTPRLIALDLPDAFTNLKLQGSLYEAECEGDTVSWSHEVTIHKQDKPYRKNEFIRDLDAIDNPDSDDKKVSECTSREEMEIDETEAGASGKGEIVNMSEKVYHLDDSVNSWTDYLKIHLHPRSLSVVKKFYHSDNSFTLHGYGLGVCTSESLDLKDELEDKIHFFTEEADHLQGFHMLSDVYDGFGGVASVLASDLNDEFSKKGCLCFCPFQSIRKTQDNSQSLHDLINSVLSLVKLTRAGFTVVPLSLVDNPWVSSPPVHKQLPGVIYKSQLAYHTSAVMAAALDSATLSHRVLDGPLLLPYLTDTLSTSHKMVSNLSVAMPVPLEQGKKTPTDGFGACCDPLTSFTPLYDVDSSVLSSAQSVMLRGAHVVDEAPFHGNILKWTPSPLRSFMQVSRACNVKSPFPHIFEGGLRKSGCYCNEPKAKVPAYAVQSLPALTSLSTSDRSRPMLKHLLERSSKLSQRHLHKHIQVGLEMDDWLETLNDLKDLTQRYCDDEDSEESDNE